MGTGLAINPPVYGFIIGRDITNFLFIGFFLTGVIDELICHFTAAADEVEDDRYIADQQPQVVLCHYLPGEKGLPRVKFSFFELVLQTAML